MKGRWPLAAAMLALVLLAACLAGGGWYFAGQIYDDGLALDRDAPTFGLRVVAVDAGTVTLTEAGATGSAVGKPVSNALIWPTGTGQLSPTVGQVDGARVTRQLTVEAGSPPVPGQRARLDNDVLLTDPKQALGLDFTDVRYSSPGGEFAAWYVPPAVTPTAAGGSNPGRARPWAVMAHGRGASRTEMLRALGVVHANGMPALVITYRNDRDQPVDRSRLYRYGATEWVDLAGAVRYARDHGATSVVPVAASMGGGIVAAFLQHSDLAGLASGLVLEAPMLDFDSVVNFGASQRRLPLIGVPIPDPLTTTAKWIAGWRYGVHWSAIDYLRDTSWIRVPTLVLHGEGDLTVPIGDSARLAAARPELVTLERFPVAGHVESWNADRARYERVVGGFLALRD